MNSVDVLRKERGELAGRIKALDSAIATLGGKSGRSSVSAAKRKKISRALKKSWAARKAKGKA